MKILAVDQNINHTEQVKTSVPTEPIVFSMPDSALLKNGQDFYLPHFSKEIHCGLQLVVKINKLGKKIPVEFAHRYYEEIALGIDFTAQDILENCKQKGLPWEKAKAFDGAAPISSFVSKAKFSSLQNLNFSLKLNHREVQMSNTANMIFSINDLIAHLSRYFTLKIGDLIFTGSTPQTNLVKIGDRLTATLENKQLFDFYVR